MSDTCPECGKLVIVVDDTIALHSKPDGSPCGAGLKKLRSVIAAKRIRGAEDDAASLRAHIATLEARVAELTREREAGAKEAECFECHRRCKWFDEQGAPWDRARAVGVRCADCGYVLCRDCALKHFGKEFARLREGHATLASSAVTLADDLRAARAERDEAVGLLRACLDGWIKGDDIVTPMHAAAYLAVPSDQAHDGECVRCIKCKRCCGACDCTGGPQTEQECTCYEHEGGHQPGCYFNRKPAVPVAVACPDCGSIETPETGSNVFPQHDDVPFGGKPCAGAGKPIAAPSPEKETTPPGPYSNT